MLDGQDKIARNVFVYQGVFMDTVKNLLNANVKKGGKECFVTNQFVKRPANMEVAITLGNAYATQDGQAQIVIFVSSSQGALKMAIAPNRWNVFASMDTKDASVIKPNAEMVVIKQMVTVINQMSVGVMLVGQGPDVMSAYPIQAARMAAVTNHGNVTVKADTKENYVIKHIQNMIPLSNIIT